MLRLIERTLNDAVLGFLALASLFLMVAPGVFAFPPGGERAVLVAENTIIGLFALEYLASLVLASDKREFVTNPWRVIDALIIVAPLVTLFPAAPEFFRSSPVLRLLRLARFALLGTRSGLALAAPPEVLGVGPTAARSDLTVRALGRSGEGFETISWESALMRIRSSQPDWMFVSGVSEDHLTPIAEALGVPEKPMRGLFHSTVPRIDRLERFSALFVRYPLPMREDGRLHRTPVLLIGSAENVVVLSREHTDLERRAEERLASLAGEMPRMARATLALLSEIVRAYSEVVEHLEAVLLGIEVEQARLKDDAFLARTFDLRADVLRVRSSLKHLKSEMRDDFFEDLAIEMPDAGNRNLFGLLAGNMGDLYDSVEDVRESLQALVDLRLNVSSFQMNRVMRLLALLTALALIPATAGGLLGMNLQDTPWPATLSQVSFGLAGGMALSLYVFAIKGWLR